MNIVTTRPDNFLLKLLIFFVMAFICLIHFLLLAPGVDAGLHLYGSMLVSRGLSPYHHLWNNKPPLIYIIGAGGFLLKSNPFLGVRLIELIFFFLDLYLIFRIVLFLGSRNPLLYLLSFSAIYLVCWDQGFLTESFSIPISLVALYQFLRKSRYFEWTCSLLLTLAFLLKQNAICVPVGIIAIDIFTPYRGKSIFKKLLQYAVAIGLFAILSYLILKTSGNWDEFYDQTILYNSLHVPKPSFSEFLVNQFWHNSFISFRGVSAIMVFHLAMVITIWHKWKMKKKGYSFTQHDQVIIASILIYLISYPLVFVSGKTYPHYFMLLIIPSTWILAHYVDLTIVGRIALGFLLIAGLISNSELIRSDREMSESRTEIAKYLKSRTNHDEYIHVAGFGYQSIYVTADRLSHTKFLMPLFENNGYSDRYKQIILTDFTRRPPKFIVFSRKSYRSLDPSNFYTEVLMNAIPNYSAVFENKEFTVYKRQASSVE